LGLKLLEREEELRSVIAQLQQCKAEVMNLGKGNLSAIQASQQSIFSVRDELDNTRKETNALRSRVEEEQALNVSLSARVAELDRKLVERDSELEVQRSKLREQAQMLRDSVERTDTISAESAMHLIEQRRQCEELSRRVNQLRSQMCQAEEARRLALAGTDDVQRQLSDCRVSMEAKEQQAQQLQDDVDELRKENSRLIELLEAARRSLATAQLESRGRSQSLEIHLASEHTLRTRQLERQLSALSLWTAALLGSILAAFDEKVELAWGSACAVAQSALQSLTTDRAEYQDLLRAHQSQADLLADLRAEIAQLYRKYRSEAEGRAAAIEELSRVSQAIPGDTEQQTQKIAEMERELQVLRASRRGKAVIDIEIADLVMGIREACKVMSSLSYNPPLPPDLATLVAVYEWLMSARERSEMLFRREL
jgi:chromosome segregation ATPase